MTCLVLLILVSTTACSSVSIPQSLVAAVVNANRSLTVLLAASAAMPDLSAVTALLKSFVSEQSGIPAAQISLQQAEAVNWNDSCLGLAQPDEMCLQAITPGYRVTFTTPSGEYVVHSNQNGRSHRLAP